MHGTIRYLETPPVSSREAFAALDAAKAADPELRSTHYTMIESQGVAGEPGALTVGTYDSVALNRSVVQIVAQGKTAGGEDARVTLWFDPIEANLFAKQIKVNALHVASHNHAVRERREAAAQAALEQDCDRREELIRLGHES